MADPTYATPDNVLFSHQGGTRPLHAPRWGAYVADTPGTDAGGGSFSVSSGDANQDFVVPDDMLFAEIDTDADVHVYVADETDNLGSAAGARRKVKSLSSPRVIPVFPGGVMRISYIDSDAEGEVCFGG